MVFSRRSLPPLLLVALSILFGGVTVFALPSDVPEESWYSDTLEMFLDEGILTVNDDPFRPGDDATRAEFIDILMQLTVDYSGDAPADPAFDDVPRDSRHYLPFQQAARLGILKGAGDCIGTSPCFAYPDSPINRAETAILLLRAFGLSLDDDSPSFADVEPGAWYEVPIRTAAAHCILRGNAITHFPDPTPSKVMVRPEDNVNRAEMIVMIARARQNLRYGVDCGRSFPPPDLELPSRPRHPEDETPEPRTFLLPEPATPTGVPLMRFDMSAHKVRDIVLTGLTFEAEQGSLLNAEKYALWVDHDGNGVVETPLETGVSPDDDFVTFQDLFGGGYVITEQTVTFEVRAAISGSPQSTTLQLRVAANGIEAEELDGRALSGIRKDGICSGRCQITQQTTPAEIITILPHGNLFVSESSIPIRSHLLLGGAITDPILRLTFRADDEDIALTTLRISSSGSTAQSIERLELLTEGSSTPFTNATVSACSGDDVLALNPTGGSAITTFCANIPSSAFIVEDNERRDLLIRAKMRSDAAGGISGEAVQLWLTGQAVSDAATGSGAIEARGMSSSESISANDGDGTKEGEIFMGRETPGTNQNIVGSMHTSVFSAFAGISNGSDDSNGDPVPSGTHELGAFTFTAATNANTEDGTNVVVIDDLLFTMSSTNVTFDASSFSLFNRDDSTVVEACTAVDSGGSPLAGSISGSFFVLCENLDSSSIPSDIASGDSLILALQGSISNPQVSSSTASFLQVSLQNFTSPRSSFGVSGSHIHWLDRDGGGETDLFWVDLPLAEIGSTQYRL